MSILKRVFANPRVTPGVVVFLLLVTLVAVPRALDAAADRQERREFEQARTWTTDPWTLTTADFPGHERAVVPVESRWMSPDRKGGWTVEPVRATGLAPLFHHQFPHSGFALSTKTSGVSGVRVDGTEVYSYVVTPSGPGYDTAEGSFAVWHLQEEASRIAENLLAFPHDWDEWRDAELVSVGYVGAPTEPGWTTSHASEPFEPGGPGYFGVTVDERTADGASSRTTTIGTVVEGSLAVVGVVVPDGVAPAADLEPALLLERLSQRLRADPPAAPDPSSGPGRTTQADSRTTREVGSVMAAGS